MKLVGEDMFFLLVKSIFFLPLYVGAYYTSTPDEKTYIEEGSSVPFLWTVNGSSTVTEVYFGTGDADELKSGYLRVQPGNKVIPQARYNGRVNFTGDLNTGTIRFQLSNVNRSDGNKYYGCDTYIKPQGGSLTLLRWKQPILLNVLVAPKFYSVPTVPSSLKEGDSLSIVCSTSDGNPTPVVSWMKGAVNVSSGWGRADLNFTSLKRENSDKYECVATNRLTTIKHTIQLDVLFKPEDTRLTSNASGNVTISGDYILLTCTVGAAKPAVSQFRFYRDNNQLSAPSEGKYLIENIQYSDRGIYKCIPHNDIGDGPGANLNLAVNEPAKIISSPTATITVVEGEAIPLVCKATGHPQPTVTWKKDGQPFDSGENVTIVKSTRNSKGVYTCTATNNVKEPQTSTATVTVHYQPEINTGVINSTVGSWDSNQITLQCVAVGLPAPTFQWYDPGNQQINTSVSPIPGGSRVTVTTSDSEDYGQYKCRATNVVGSTDHSITVIQLNKPGKPLKVMLKETQASYVRVSWTPPGSDGGSKIIDYKVEIQRSTDSRSKLYDDKVTGMELLVDQLTPGASYSVLVYARNIVGYGEAALLPFITNKQGKPGIPLLNITMYNTGVTLIWSAAAENGGEILTYTVWQREVQSDKAVGRWTKENITSDDLTYTVTGLENGKTYQFGVTAWNKYGESALDEEKGLKQVEIIELTEASPKKPGTPSPISAAAIGGGAAAAVVIILLVIIVIVLLKRRKASPRKAGESRDPLGSSGDEGYSSVSKASAARRLGRNNAASEDAGVPTYATVDMSKKKPKKPDLIYAELADFNENPAAQAASMKRQNQANSYVPSDYAEIAQFGRPSEEPTYDNVPRY